MDTVPKDTTVKASILPPTRARLFWSAAKYLAGKALTILITIFVGVFITMLIVGYPSGNGSDPGKSPFESRLESEIELYVRGAFYSGVVIYDPNAGLIEDQMAALTEKLRAEAGLNLPYLPRNLLWTFKALSFNWGELSATYVDKIGTGPSSTDVSDNVILQFLPNTLLLVGTAYLLVFLIGMPLALYLARQHGSRLDRFMAVLSPISSVPSWVFAVLLIAVFAVQLRWLPVGGMFDFHRPEDPIEYTAVLLKHMILPVSALMLSLLFQLIYTWRTFFIIYSEEDYVELARAKGLKNRTLEKQYILKPALPYIITSFTTSLISFWQLTVALEAVFQWPGVGLLYIEALPNYWGDRVTIGDLMIVIQIVVTFAYLLGLLVFILDIVYVIIDPRIHLMPAGSVAQTQGRVIRKKTFRDFLPIAWMKSKSPGLTKPLTGPVMKRTFSWSEFWSNTRESIREINARNSLFLQELRRYPSAIFGLIVIAVLLAGSLYAVLALPYEEFGRTYDEDRVRAYNHVPRLAAPIWFNFFSRTPRLSTLILDENSPGANVSSRTLDNGWVEKTVTFNFEYNYGDIPSDVFLYLDPEYLEKLPFASMLWTTPDGRIIDLKGRAVSGSASYDFEANLSIVKLLNQNAEWKNWFTLEKPHSTPAYNLLFAKPGATQPVPQNGTYQLKVTSLLFEEDSDVHPQLVLLGHVYGGAGTDLWRRDLVVPLFWGMPFAFIVGLFGTLITTLVAMLLPAMGVWFGGWLDSFIQRLTEVNMVLPGLAIAVLANLLFGTSVWVLLGIVVLLNALGGPIKTFRSAFLQAKEAPYMEVARSYGASNSRMITHYLVPRILPVFIPHLVSQIPSFIFLEATLGFFNIKSNYPSWGRIIYEGLSRGALYGSPFWVLEPIFLLLLTGLAFATLGSALERILNPRVIDQAPLPEKRTHKRSWLQRYNKRIIAGIVLLLILFMIMASSSKAKTFSNKITPTVTSATGETTRTLLNSALTIAASAPTDLPATVSEASSTPTPIPSIETTAPSVATPTLTPVTLELVSTPVESIPTTYTLQKGENPYCVARRFNVDPNELIMLNSLDLQPNFYAGVVLKIPRTARTFPGDRVLQTHPAVYTVSSQGETVHSVPCLFGDVDPVSIAQVNLIPIGSVLLIGQPLNIP